MIKLNNLKNTEIFLLTIINKYAGTSTGNTSLNLNIYQNKNAEV